MIKVRKSSSRQQFDTEESGKYKRKLTSTSTERKSNATEINSNFIYDRLRDHGVYRMTFYDISVIIPTRNRSNDLMECISAIANQNTLPKEIIIVDDGDLARDIISELYKELPSSVSLHITESDGVPGTSTARNTGAQIASYPIVLILDDDAIIGPGYIERLQKIYEKYDNNDLAGVGGFDNSLRDPGFLEQIYDKLFLLGNEGWSVNNLGFQSWDATLSAPASADWLSGNNASYKREVILSNPFPHWSGGREALEDVAMGVQLKQNGLSCIIDPGLCVTHHEADDNESSFTFGIKLARNRVRIFEINRDSASVFLFLWAMFGDILKTFLTPIYKGMWKRYWTTGIGMIAGLLIQSLPYESPLHFQF
jgi:GT2 family glycosyltransferase